jgi:chromosomal replication initiation ATPase DnaA
MEQIAALTARVEKLEALLPPAIQGEPAEVVLAIVARQFGVSVPAMRSACRSAHLVRARWCAMLILRERFKYSLQRIGRAFQRDHGTVMSGLMAIRSERNLYPIYNSTCLTCEVEVQATLIK